MRETARKDAQGTQVFSACYLDLYKKKTKRLLIGSGKGGVDVLSLLFFSPLSMGLVLLSALDTINMFLSSFDASKQMSTFSSTCIEGYLRSVLWSAAREVARIQIGRSLHHRGRECKSRWHYLL